MFEAAALGLERLHQEGGQLSAVEIIVHQPGTRFTIAPQQLSKWLGTKSEAENVGLMALKRRVRELIDAQRVFEKYHAGASRFSMMRMVAMSIMVSAVCTAYS